MIPGPSAACPCSSGSTFQDCCRPVLGDARLAATAEQLMRSRYTAFTVGDSGHLFRTWHPRTRPMEVEAGDPDWLGLTILEVVAGGADDTHGIVEFEAVHRHGALHERSTFERRAGRWMYVAAVGEG